jgi:hypothetical protein
MEHLKELFPLRKKFLSPGKIQPVRRLAIPGSNRLIEWDFCPYE